MIISRELIKRRYERLERSKKKLDWRKELVSDLKGFVILLVFWIGFCVIAEFVV